MLPLEVARSEAEQRARGHVRVTNLFGLHDGESRLREDLPCAKALRGDETRSRASPSVSAAYLGGAGAGCRGGAREEGTSLSPLHDEAGVALLVAGGPIQLHLVLGQDL